MPRAVKDIRELVTLSSRKDVKSVVIKKNGNVTKFKLRGSRFVYSLAVNDAEKAKKFQSSLDPRLEIVTITNKKPKTASA